MRHPTRKTGEFYLSGGRGVNVVRREVVGQWPTTRREMMAGAAQGTGPKENQGVSGLGPDHSRVTELAQSVTGSPASLTRIVQLSSGLGPRAGKSLAT